MIDFRSLSYFLAACEQESLFSAAQTLDLAPSTLSASLKSLESSFGTPLFRRHGSGLIPRPFAHWLYRAVVPLMLLEGFARRRLLADPSTPAHELHLHVKLRFTSGQVRRAIGRAMSETASDEPLVLINPRWTLETDMPFDSLPPADLGMDGSSGIVIETARKAADDEILLMTDTWMIVHGKSGQHRPGGEDRPAGAHRQTLMIPSFPRPLLDHVIAHMESCDAAVEILDAPPQDWPLLLEEYPGALFLLPQSAIGPRLGAPHLNATSLDPPLTSVIVARPDGSGVAERFTQRLRRALRDGGSATFFDPRMTERRIRYFNLANETGRISAAARVANVAQPALSQQLQKFEASLGVQLFERTTAGLARTRHSAQLALATGELDRRLRKLEDRGRTAALAELEQMSIGILPSVGHHSRLLGCIAQAIADVQAGHPAVSVTVREGPSQTLQALTMHGRIGIAIIENPPLRIPRFPLDADESLSVIVDPRHGLLPEGPIRMADIPALRLALPSRAFGLRQAVDAATEEADLPALKPAYQIDALPMLVAILSREPIATILPASAVQTELANRTLSAHAIIEPFVTRRLFAIYSGDRSLTAVERAFIARLHVHLGGAPGA